MLGLGLGLGIGRSSAGRIVVAHSIYRLIDGPFLYGVCMDACKLIGAESFELNLQALCGSSYRTVYYDALPIKKAKQTEVEFDEIEAKKLGFLNTMRAHPNMQVKDGITRLKTEGRRRDASEVLEQKGVDTWIAVDAVKYALTGIADEIEILTSDSDIYPAFEVIRETRSRGVLKYEFGRTREELVFSADVAHRIRLAEVADWISLPTPNSVSVAKHVPMNKKSEFELDSAKYEYGKRDQFFVVNRTAKDGSARSLTTDSYLSLIDWLNDFGIVRRWSEIDKLINLIKL